MVDLLDGANRDCRAAENGEPLLPHVRSPFVSCGDPYPAYLFAARSTERPGGA
jgi:hypothetical protein